MLSQEQSYQNQGQGGWDVLSGQDLRTDTAVQPIFDSKNYVDPRGYLVIIEPAEWQAGDYLNLFKNEGFTCIKSVDISKNVLYTRLFTRDDVMPFVQHFNGFEFRGKKITAEDYTTRQRPTKTIHISKIEDGITERDIYNYFSRLGYVKGVSLFKGFAFIEFDTTETAVSVLNRSRFITICGQRLVVHYATSPEVSTEPKPIQVPLSVFIPNDHPFWFRLYNKIYGPLSKA